MTPLPFSQQNAQEDLDCLSKTVVKTANQLKSLLFDHFSRQIAQKQLYCQSRDRLSDVDKTDKRILQLIHRNSNPKRKKLEYFF